MKSVDRLNKLKNKEIYFEMIKNEYSISYLPANLLSQLREILRQGNHDECLF